VTIYIYNNQNLWFLFLYTSEQRDESMNLIPHGTK
jgi:hypothetical protein